jgi:two-component system sensor histidine kinase YesM
MNRGKGNIFTRIQGFFFNLSITSQIAIYCFLLFAVTFLLSSVLNQQIYKNISMDQASSTVSQTLYLVDENIQNVINSVNETTKSIISNEEVRAYMRSDRYTDNVTEKTAVRNFIRNIFDNMSYKTSVHLFPRTGEVLNIGIQMVNYPIPGNIEDAAWYDSVSKEQGGYTLIYNGGGFFEKHTQHDFISMIRLFYDIETQECNGVQVTNFSTDILQTAFQDLVDEYGMQVVVCDQYGNRIAATEKNMDIVPILASAQASESGYITENIDGTDYMISSRENTYGWDIIAMMPMSGITQELYRFSYITLAFILVNGLLMFLGVSFFSRLVTQPINQLVTTMEKVKGGQLTPVTMKSNNREIASLKEGYNVMVDEINVLFDRVVDEQEEIRKSELKLLQSQIKPHFLYNTFDAISSLALMNKNQEVYEAILALGSLYRTSLSRGHDVISIEEEIEAVKNYIKILQIRYEDTFSSTIDVDERVNHMLIPKLTLQPIVENALYHGIKPTGRKGHIHISAQLDGEYVVIRIADDGVGMSEETEHKILTRNSLNFGIRGTIERLRIFFISQDVMRIESTLGKGTTVIITIPAVTEELKNAQDL